MIRTGYSFRHAAGKLADVVSRVAEIGWKVAPISDLNSTFAFNKWTKLCKENGLRPAYGVELNVAMELGKSKPIFDRWRFLAKDSLRPVHDIIHLATSNPGRESSVTYDQAMAASGTIKIMGNRVQLDSVEPNADLLLSLDPSTPKGLLAMARERGFKLVASPCNFFPRQEDLELYRVMLGFRSATQTYPLWIVSDDEWGRWIETNLTDDEKILSAAIDNRDAVLASCRAEMRQATLLVPEKPQTLRQMCVEGAADRGVNLDNQVYAERLEKELRLIDEKKFEDYFYVVADIVNWAKERMIVGPARGSSCGSLVCYLIGITAVDPIPYDLVFERFIDTTRADYPDIDLDFSESKRHLVFEYVEEKYGKDRVARLGNVSMFQSKSALKQMGAALKIAPWMIQKVSDSVIRRSKGDSRADLKVEDTLKETEAGQELMKAHPEAAIVGRMEDHPSNASQHAAGILLTNEPIREFVAVNARNNVAMCDWQDAKDLNLLKLDALGLTQLSIFERALELMGVPQTSAWLEALPLDDQEAFDVINRRHFSGVFQFGPTQQNIAIEVKTSQFEDIVAMTALCRPGPVGSGATRSWINRKNGKEKIDVPHPLLEPYLKSSLGVMIYQEQTLRVGREVGGLSWADVTVLRKLMSKSMGKEAFDKYGDPWKAGAVERGMPQKVAEDYWEKMCSYGMYNFNRSHAVAYALVAYWSMYLKAHWPVEFAAATLDAESEPIRQIQILRELRDEGVDYVAVDPQRSGARWMPVTQGENQRRILVGPLTAIKNVGPAAMREILDARESGKPLKPATQKKLSRAKTAIDSLYPVKEAIERLHPDLRAINIFTKPTPVVKVQPGEVEGDVVILCLLVRLHPLDENEPARVAKRGRKVTGPTQAVNFFVRDDTGDVFCKISRFEFSKLAPVLMNGTRQGKSLFAIRGNCPNNFRMLWVQKIKYLGEIDAASAAEAAE